MGLLCFHLERLLQEAFYYANFEKARNRLEKIKGDITGKEYNDLKTIMIYASPDYPDGGRERSLEDLAQYIKNMVYKYANGFSKDSIRCCPFCGSVLGLYSKRMIIVSDGYSYDGSNQNLYYITLERNNLNTVKQIDVTKNRKKTPLFCMSCNKRVKYLEE